MYYQYHHARRVDFLFQKMRLGDMQTSKQKRVCSQFTAMVVLLRIPLKKVMDRYFPTNDPIVFVTIRAHHRLRLEFISTSLAKTVVFYWNFIPHAPSNSLGFCKTRRTLIPWFFSCRRDFNGVHFFNRIFTT